jgi:hypothetical protein
VINKTASGRNNATDAMPSEHDMFEPGTPTWRGFIASCGLGVLLVVAVLSGVAACDSRGDGGMLCDPGDVQVCPCPGAGNGVQSCNSGGTGWNACEGCTTGQCVPKCSGKECGDDGCGGSCGTCPGNKTCNSGICSTNTCEQDCHLRQCGPDPVCGESCGKCDSGDYCIAGQYEELTAARCVGTWTDPTSGLKWLSSTAFFTYSRDDAVRYCSQIDIGGGGWHLPTVNEFRTLLRGCPDTIEGGSCNVGEGSCLEWSCFAVHECYDCSYADGPGEGGCYWPIQMQESCLENWTSSFVEDEPGFGWAVYVKKANIYRQNVDDEILVRCVR